MGIVDYFLTLISNSQKNKPHQMTALSYQGLSFYVMTYAVSEKRVTKIETEMNERFCIWFIKDIFVVED